jgi:hypothetical protein
MSQHPYTKKAKAYRVAEAAFDEFKHQAQTLVRDEITKIPRAKPLIDAHALLVEETSENSLQAWFGRRPTGRRTPDGISDVEVGASLVYSLGANGLVAAILYPAESEMHGGIEKWIILGFRSAPHLQKALPKDLRALVAYCHVTSIDGSPRYSERWLVRWLRLSKRREINGKQSIAGIGFLARAAELVARAGLTAIFRIGLIVVVLLLAGWAGWDWLVGFFAKRY